MGNRFSLKDFIFLVAFILVIGAVVWNARQFSWQETRLTDLRKDVDRLAGNSEKQANAFRELSELLRRGGSIGATTQTSQVSNERKPIRRTDADGSQFVYYPDPPQTPNEPRNLPDYAAGDWLVQNLGSEPKYITPYIERENSGSTLQNYVIESLITRNPETLEWEPWLAESYSISADGLVYRFTLRSGVKFSDGKPMTAEDVLFSYNLVSNPKVDSDRLRSYLTNVEYCKIIDERTVEFKYKEKYFKAFEVVGAYFEIIPKHIYGAFTPEQYNEKNALLVGSGQYVLGKWLNGQQVELLRNENYWGPKPTFDKIVLKFIQNPQTALQSFMDEGLDSHSPQPEQYEDKVKNQEFLAKYQVRRKAIPNAGYRYIGWNLANPIFADKGTRQALSMMVDRKSLIHTIDRDLAVELSGPFSPMVPQYDKTIQPRPFDPAAAEAKLKDAGWNMGPRGVLVRDGQEFAFEVMIPAQSAAYEKIATIVQAQFKRVGIEVRVAPFEWSVLVDRLDNRKFDAAILGWTGGIEGDPYQIWHSSQIAGKGSNFIGYKNAEADRLIMAGRTETNETKRMEIWHKFHQQIHEDAPYVFLSMRESLSFVNGRIKNIEPYLTGMNSGDWYVPVTQQKYGR